MKAKDAMSAVRKAGRKEKARILSSFFKTGKGEYGEGDKFLGVTVPEVRSLARRFLSLTLPEVKKLLVSQFHEERLLGLIILVGKFRRGSLEDQAVIFDFYVRNLKGVNNWDLVDLSSHEIAGEWLRKTKSDLLYILAESERLWERRIAVVSTYAFIKAGELKHTFRLSKLLLEDKEDLIHKACGWMLREAGKRDEKALRDFLDKYARKMPRTMLRYAIERFPERVRREYLRRPL